ncbi:MAG TPA: hypothetical protein VGK73_24835 [Polyangiaceae bacterium]
MTKLSRIARWEFAWCAALVVLVVNDHVLKGAGVVPSAVTGKLSDFAGLFVAPVLLAGVLRRSGFGGPTVRLLSFAAIATVFGAIKLSEAAAELLEVAVSLVGLQWKIWSDPSDLIGFGILPFAWRAASKLDATRPEGSRRRVHTVAAALGGFACLATSEDPHFTYSTSSYLANVTPAPVEVTVFRPNIPLECDTLADTAAALPAGAFEPEFCQKLVPREIVPLDRGSRGIQGTSAQELRYCGAVVLQAEGLPDTLVFWDTTTRDEVSPQPDAWLSWLASPNSVVLEQADGRLFATGTEVVQVTDYAGKLPRFACEALPRFDEVDHGAGGAGGE